MTHKILYATDLHGNEAVYNKLFDFIKKNKLIKALILGGDLCPRGGSTLDERVKLQKDFILNFLIPELKEIKIEKYIMLGNDDYRINMSILEKEEKKKTFHLLHKKLNKLHKFNIVGYAFVPQMPFLLKDWEKLDNKSSKQITDPNQDVVSMKREPGTIEDDLKKLKKLADPKKTIYVLHSPPYGTALDVTGMRENVGSKSTREFIEKEQPPLTLHGHIHESLIMGGEYKEKIGKTICINPGSDYQDNFLNFVIIDLDNLDDIEHEII